MPSPSVLQQLGYKGTSLYLPEPLIIVFMGRPLPSTGIWGTQT